MFRHYRSFLIAIAVAISMILLVTACLAPTTATPATSSNSGIAADGADLSGELIIFAAASLIDAFGEIGANFEAAHPGTDLIFNFAGSQQLSQQLGQGAPADVFASANVRQMEVAIASGRVVSGTQRTFVRNRLVVIYPAENPAEIATLEDLATPGIKLVLAAAEVPVGAYSVDFLNKATATAAYGADYGEMVLANVVSYEENVRSVLSKVILGEADAGIVYTSDVFGDAAQVGQIDIPDALNTVASYPIAPVVDSDNPDLAEAFVEYVLSEEGQAVLADYGFVPGADSP